MAKGFMHRAVVGPNTEEVTLGTMPMSHGLVRLYFKGTFGGASITLGVKDGESGDVFPLNTTDYPAITGAKDIEVNFGALTNPVAVVSGATGATNIVIGVSGAY